MAGRQVNPGRRGKAPPPGHVATQVELGAMLGVSVRQARDLLADGMREACLDRTSGCYSVSGAWDWRITQGRLPRGLVPAPSPTVAPAVDGRDLEELRAEHEAVKIELSQHKLALARGDVITRDEIATEWAKRAARVRDDLRSAADTLPPRVVGHPESRVRALLRDAFRRICNRYAGEDG